MSSPNSALKYLLPARPLEPLYLCVHVATLARSSDNFLASAFEDKWAGWMLKFRAKCRKMQKMQKMQKKAFSDRIGYAEPFICLAVALGSLRDMKILLSDAVPRRPPVEISYTSSIVFHLWSYFYTLTNTMRASQSSIVASVAIWHPQRGLVWSSPDIRSDGSSNNSNYQTRHVSTTNSRNDSFPLYRACTRRHFVAERKEK